MLQTDHVEQFLQYLYQAMNQDPVWQGKGVKVITGVLCAWESHCKFIRYWLNANILRWYGTLYYVMYILLKYTIKSGVIL